MSRTALRGFRGRRPPVVTPPPATRYLAGVAVGALQPWNTRRAQDYAAMAAMGAYSVRTDIGWMYVQPQQNTWTIDRFADTVRDAQANGMRFLAILHTTPAWANQGAGDYALPGDKTLLEEYAYRVGKFYIPLGVTEYEFANEINYSRDGWIASGATYATQWLPFLSAGLLRASVEVGTPVTRILGSLAPGEWGGDNAQDPVTFLRQVYANGGRGKFDAISWHPYTGADAPETSPNMGRRLDDLHDVLAANGDGNLKIWGTEYGSPTGGLPGTFLSEGTQAAYAVRALPVWYRRSDTGPLFIYSARDTLPVGDATDREGHFGILRNDDTPKPALAALTAVLERPASATRLDDEIMADGPELYLPCDNLTTGIRDRSGNGHHATVQGTPQLTSAPNGLGTALLLNPGRIGDSLTVPDHPALSISHTRRFTAVMWIRIDDLEFSQPPYRRQGSNPGYLHLWTKGYDTGNNKQCEWAWRLYPKSDTRHPSHLCVYCYNLNGALGTGSSDQAKAPRHPRRAGEWLQVGMEVDMTVLNEGYPGIWWDENDHSITSSGWAGWIRMYLNGVLRDIDPLANYKTVPSDGSHPLRIGSSDVSWFPGAIWRPTTYTHLLGPRRHMAHYRAVYPLQAGAGGLRRQLGSASGTAAGTTLQMTCTAATGGGEVAFVAVAADYTGSEPTVTDQRGNAWAPVQYANTTGNQAKTVLFKSASTTPLQAGDWIRATWPGSVTRKVMTACTATGLAGPVAVDRQNTYNSKSATDVSQTPPKLINESPMVDLTTSAPRTIMVGVICLQVATTPSSFLVDDPEGWLVGGQASTTGGTTGADRSLILAVRSVPTQDDYTFAATSTVAGRWVAMATSFKAA